MLVTALLCLAVLLGAMVFFPAVVAPLVFRVLQPADAGAFLRALFPRYYLFMIVTSGLAGLLLIFSAPLPAVVLLAIAASTLGIRQWLVPRLNAWRDQARAGDAMAERRFERGHRLSVAVNMVQLLLVAAVLVHQLMLRTG